MRGDRSLAEILKMQRTTTAGGGIQLLAFHVLRPNDIWGQAPRPSALFVSVAADASTGLKKPSLIDCYQIHSLAGQRLGAKLGKAPPETLAEVRVRIAKILDIGEEHLR